MRSRRRALLAGACASAALVVGACATSKPIPRTTPAPAADELLAALRARQASVRAVDLETRTTSWLGGDRIVLSVTMLADRAGRLLFLAETALAGPVAQLATNGRDFALLDLQENALKKGPACPENIARLLPVPLMPDEVAALLLGDAPVPPDARAVSVGWDEKEGADVLEVEGRSVTAARLWITMRKGSGGVEILAVAGAPAGAGRDRWRVRYEDLTRKAGVALPQVVRFAEPGRSFDEGVTIKIKERTLNPELRDEAFVIAPRGDVPVEIVPCARPVPVKIEP